MYYYPSSIATILSPQSSTIIIKCPNFSLSSLVLFLVRTVALWWLNAQGRLDAGERGDAEEDDGNEDEKYKQQTGDERGREQLIAGEYTARGGRGGGRVVVRAPRAG